ncbi:MAG: UDP-N-acetylmuramoyl-tripeptide--D-alanyl-D-alanine ligase [Planctomycetes bacterium]|nr:UDP-N-acetylmuramoyl-tripeptide--D-alanyl-D-alanine ligase [Planctomycetota bacterium]
MIDLQTLRQVLGARPNGHDKDAEMIIHGVSTDTRTIRRGDCFFAVIGPNFDGHNFVVGALEKGAACVVVQKQVALPSELQCRALWVEDTVKSLGRLAAWYRGRLKAKVVAITGSAGKTTTRHIIHHILSRRFNCHQATGSFNNHIGLPLTILSARDEHDVLVLELGTNHPGEIGYLTRIAAPDIAMVLNAAPAHLEGFGSIDNIIREKLSIQEGLAGGGLFILNGDQPELVAYAKTLNRPFITFGVSPTCDIRAQNLQTDGDAGQLTIEGRTMTIPLPGRANLLNVLAAWAICKAVGVSLPDFAEALSSLQPVVMRMSVESVGPIKIINDCYNANPASMANALDYLATVSQKEQRRAVFVAGCMAELGSASAKLHYELGQRAAQAGIGCVAAAGAFASDIIAGAVGAGFDASACQTFTTTQALCDNLHNFIQPADIILVKGSRAAGMEKAVERLRSLFGSANGRHPALCENKK